MYVYRLDWTCCYTTTRAWPARPQGCPQGPRGAHKGLARKGPGLPAKAQGAEQGPGPHGPSLQEQ